MSIRAAAHCKRYMLPSASIWEPVLAGPRSDTKPPQIVWDHERGHGASWVVLVTTLPTFFWFAVSPLEIHFLWHVASWLLQPLSCSRSQPLCEPYNVLIMGQWWRHQRYQQRKKWSLLLSYATFCCIGLHFVLISLEHTWIWVYIYKGALHRFYTLIYSLLTFSFQERWISVFSL